MTGAMYSAIAGLKTHMQNLNVIGHNVANVNTMGYKTQRSIFQSALYTSLRAGSAGTTTVGGTNPSQIGYGSNLGSVDMMMGTSTYAATGDSMDCMIDGDGFFMVGTKDIAATIDPDDPTTLKNLTLTRVGDFEIKADGYLSDRNGNVVYGFMCVGIAEDGTPIMSDQLVGIRMPQMEKVPVGEDGNELTGADATDKTKIKGYTYKIHYAKVGGEDTGAGTGTGTADAAGVGTSALTNYSETMQFAEFDTISIDEKTGKLSGTVKDTDQTITIGFIALANVTNPNGVTQMSGTYYKAGEAAGDMTVAMMGGAASDVWDVRNCSWDTTNGKWVAPTWDETTQTWIPAGGAAGGGNNNANVSKGIEHVNGSLYTPPADDANKTQSDKMEIRGAGSTGLLTSGLEQSNVDLATEISQMILTQRGYQANTRIITVTDSMLEELVNMKRS